jgi:folate-dependent phosphoribosylglycinamide formyltransferase PurN
VTVKRLVLLAGPGEPTNITYHALSGLLPPSAVVIEKPVPRAQFLKNRAKKLGWITVAGQILFSSLVLPRLRKSSQSRRGEILREFGMNTTPIPEEEIIRVDSVNSEDCIQQLKRLNPDFVFLCGTRILARRVLESVPAIFLNIHAGITPLYRGVHGAYWALVRGQRQACGVTVHLVDPGIDTGGILAQALIEPTPEDCFVTYPLLQLGVGLRLMPEVLRRLAKGERWTLPAPAGASSLWSHPTLYQYLRNRQRYGAR